MLNTKSDEFGKISADDKRKEEKKMQRKGII